MIVSFYCLADSSCLRSEREILERWRKEYPALVEAYDIKEAYHDLYSYKSKDDALRAAQDWSDRLSGDMELFFRETRNALHSWWDEIFHFYDVQISNAYTESVNNLAKTMNRMGRGYSFEVIRARLIYDNDTRKDTRTTVRKKVRKKVRSIDDGCVGKVFSAPTDTYKTVIVEKTVEYGPYIPSIVKKLKAGGYE